MVNVCGVLECMVGRARTFRLRVNSAGMIPLIFAQSIMIFPSTIASYFYDPTGTGIFQSVVNGVYENLRPANDAWLYWIMYFLMVIGFTYFYTDVIFRQQNLAESLQRQGGFIPGLRPGKRTEEYLNRVLQRITLVGAVFLGIGGHFALAGAVAPRFAAHGWTNPVVAHHQHWPAHRRWCRA